MRHDLKKWFAPYFISTGRLRFYMNWQINCRLNKFHLTPLIDNCKQWRKAA